MDRLTTSSHFDAEVSESCFTDLLNLHRKNDHLQLTEELAVSKGPASIHSVLVTQKPNTVAL